MLVIQVYRHVLLPAFEGRVKGRSVFRYWRASCVRWSAASWT
jgi:hypothetical protein